MMKQDRAQTRPSASFNIARGVADQPRLSQVDIQSASGAVDHARPGFAAVRITPVSSNDPLRMIGAEFVTINDGSGILRAQQLIEARVDGMDISLTVQTAGNPALVGNGDDEITHGPGAGDGLGGASMRRTSAGLAR